MKSIRAIMLARNETYRTLRALRALEAQLAGRDARICLVDHGSRPGSLKPVVDGLEGTTPVELSHADPDAGYAEIVNATADRASEELLLLLDNDTELAPQAIAILDGSLAADVRAAAVGPKLVYPDGRLEQAGLALPLWLVPIPVGRDQRADDHRFNFPRAAFALSTSCLLIRRVAFDSIGGLTADFKWGYEAVDLALRLRQRRWNVVYEPRAVCMHEGAVTLRQRPELTSSDENRQRFLQLWGADVLQRVSQYLDRLVVDGPPQFYIYGSGQSAQHLANTLAIGGYRVAGFLNPEGRVVRTSEGGPDGSAAIDRDGRILIATPAVRDAEDHLAEAGLLAGAALPILLE